MAYKLVNKGHSYSSPVKEYVADTKEDLGTIDKISLGYRAYVVDEGRWYMADSKKNWVIDATRGCAGADGDADEVPSGQYKKTYVKYPVNIENVINSRVSFDGFNIDDISSWIFEGVYTLEDETQVLLSSMKSFGVMMNLGPMMPLGPMMIGIGADGTMYAASFEPSLDDYKESGIDFGVPVRLTGGAAAEPLDSGSLTITSIYKVVEHVPIEVSKEQLSPTITSLER